MSDQDKNIIRPISRERDEEILCWLRWRSDGVSTTRIGRHVGKAPALIVQATNRVRAADIDESGDPDVAGAYWGASG